MKTIPMCLLLLCHLSTALGQQDYYRLPHDRAIEDGQIALPNLKTEDIFYFLSAYGAVHFQSSTFSNPSQLLHSEPATRLIWGMALGQNSKDKWIYELGYQCNPLSLKWLLLDPDNKISAFGIDYGSTEHGLAFKVQRRLLTLDRVSKRTRLYATIGLKYGFSKNDNTGASYAFLVPIFMPNQVDTLKVKTTFAKTAPAISGIAGLSLIGRVAEPLEIGIYADLFVDSPSLMHSSIRLQSPNQALFLSDLTLNRASIQAGVNIRWNFHHGIRYRSGNY